MVTNTPPTFQVAEYAGPKALGFANAQNKFNAPWDSIPRFEINDSKSKLLLPLSDIKSKMQAGQPVTIGQVLQHNDLYRNYPELKNIPLKFGKDATNDGEVKKGTNAVFISPVVVDGGPKDAPYFKSVLLHELQHMIQFKEGFQLGKPNQSYQDRVGEIEARDVQARMNMTPAQRLQTKPYTSQLKFIK